MSAIDQKPAVSQEEVRRQFQSLDAIFAPRNVALIGATENAASVGRTLMKNLITNPFGGAVYPVNPKRSAVLGVKAYASMRDIPDPVDLAVIVTPSKSVPALIEECVELGVGGAVIISAGFKEIGAEGVALEQRILATAAGKMRIVGPNCLGVMMPHHGLNATFARGMARPGNVAFISQSGALLTSVLDWSFKENVGFSAFVSVGSMLDVNWGDLISYFGDDPLTESIVIYMESVGDARSFLSAAREVARDKPIIVIKAGRTEAAAHAAASHTGSLAGSDDVLDAAFNRAGILRVDSIADVFYTVEALSKQPRPKGNRLTIVTNAGGPGVLATDALILGGGQLSTITRETIEKLNTFLPAAWSHGNPIDVLGDAQPERYAKALEIAAQDPNSDGLLVIMTPQDMTDPTITAQQLVPYAKIEGKPVLASWMGGNLVEAGEAALNAANIPTLPYPDVAARLFNYMWRFSDNLRAIYQTPALSARADNTVRSNVEAMLDSIRQTGRTILTETESKQVLAAYDIPTVPMIVAPTEDDAVAAAEKLNYPVVLKLHSETITHKSDVGGVKLNLSTPEEVREAFRSIRKAVAEKAHISDFLGVAVQPMMSLKGYELIVGCSPDPQFGPVLLFGMGGILVEVFKDKALGLPPLTNTLARRMMEKTTIFKALQGVRGQKSVDLTELERILVRFSQLVTEQRWIKEIDINPLLCSSDKIVALDARVVLYDKDMQETDIPRLAIRPYPSEYVGDWTMKDGTPTIIRPIRPEDEPLMVTFHETLSERSVVLRYFYPTPLSQRIEHERLSRLAFIDYDREMALVAETKNRRTGEAQIIAAGRLIKLYGGEDAEYTILVSDMYQGLGLGSEMLRRLIDIGRKEGLQRIFLSILNNNQNMLRVTERFGFRVVDEKEGVLRVELAL